MSCDELDLGLARAVCMPESVKVRCSSRRQRRQPVLAVRRRSTVRGAGQHVGARFDRDAGQHAAAGVDHLAGDDARLLGVDR